jgi:hypothetical protein
MTLERVRPRVRLKLSGWAPGPWLCVIGLPAAVIAPAAVLDLSAFAHPVMMWIIPASLVCGYLIRRIAG